MKCKAHHSTLQISLSESLACSWHFSMKSRDFIRAGGNFCCIKYYVASSIKHAEKNKYKSKLMLIYEQTQKEKNSQEIDSALKSKPGKKNKQSNKPILPIEMCWCIWICLSSAYDLTCFGFFSEVKFNISML